MKNILRRSPTLLSDNSREPLHNTKTKCLFSNNRNFHYGEHSPTTVKSLLRSTWKDGSSTEDGDFVFEGDVAGITEGLVVEVSA
jgi:hypothetical protein